MSANPLTFPAIYLLIRQCPRKGCDVVRIDTEANAETVLFHGNRWQAKREGNTLAKAQGLKLFNVRERTRLAVKRGIPASVVECPVS